MLIVVRFVRLYDPILTVLSVSLSMVFDALFIVSVQYLTLLLSLLILSLRHIHLIITVLAKQWLDSSSKTKLPILQILHPIGSGVMATLSALKSIKICGDAKTGYL